MHSHRADYVLFEFWRTTAPTATSPGALDDDRLFEDLYFLVARGTQPTVSTERRVVY